MLEQYRGALGVGGQAVLGDQVLIAGVQKQRGALGRPDEIVGDVEIAFRDEQLVGLYRVDLESGTPRGHGHPNWEVGTQA